jgi:hypothetical protein
MKRTIITTLSYICEGAIYIFLGISFSVYLKTTVQNKDGETVTEDFAWSFIFVLSTIFVILVSRFFLAFIFTIIINK